MSANINSIKIAKVKCKTSVNKTKIEIVSRIDEIHWNKIYLYVKINIYGIISNFLIYQNYIFPIIIFYNNLTIITWILDNKLDIEYTRFETLFFFFSIKLKI